MSALSALQMAAGTTNPANLLIWGAQNGKTQFKDFIWRMSERTGSRSWSTSLGGGDPITATLVNKSGDTSADRALKAALWALRYPGIAANEAWRMGMGMSHGIEGRAVGPTTQDDANSWIFNRTMLGPGRAHGFVVTSAMIVALIGLLATLASAAIPALIGLQSDTIKYEHEEAMAAAPASRPSTSPLITSVIRPMSRTGITTVKGTTSAKKEEPGGVVLPVGIGALAYLLL